MADPSERQERSCQALLTRFETEVPDLAELLQRPAGTAAVTDDQGRIIDLDLGTSRLYRGDGRKVSEEQVEAYLAQPLRFFITDTAGANGTTGMARRMSNFLNQQCIAAGLTTDDLDLKPDYQGSYLVVLGLGLGFHLERLIRETKVRHVFLVEPTAEFLRQSLVTIDWEALLSEAEARGIRFSLSLSTQPERIVGEILAMFSAEGEPFIDGTFVFQHYPSWVLREARDQLAADIQLVFLSRGFYEDELIMMTNSTRNMNQTPFHLLDAQPKLARSEPVFIIGSGPSLDRDLPHIKRWREHAVVFSCGSGLRACLQNGIRPDFHCEIENGPLVYDMLQTTLEVADLSGITLTASLTVDPRVPPLFDQSYLFFRDSVSSTEILARPEMVVRAASPTVANTALSTATAMGFTQFYLFGIDCGSKVPSHRHAVDSVYHVDQKLIQDDTKLLLEEPLPGNFGGTVYSYWVYNFSRYLLSAFLKTYRVKAWNCSDGARIEGALPKLAASLKLSNPVLDRAAIKAQLDRQLPLYQPGAYLEHFSQIDFTAEIERYFADLLALIDQALAEDRDFVAFWARLARFFKESERDYMRVHSVPGGTSRSLPKIGMFFVHRVRDPVFRAALFRDFLEEYRRMHEDMRDGTLALFEQVKDRIRPAAAP